MTTLERPVPTWTPPRPLARRVASLAAKVAIVLALAATFALGGRVAFAMFTKSNVVTGNALGAGRIFSGTWQTAAFSVADASSGAEVDASNPLAFAGDGRTITSKAWATTFDPGRYLQFDLSSPLPAGLAVTGATVNLTIASSPAGVTSCLYLDVRRQSTGAVLATYGSAGSPLGCVTGTTPTTISTAIGIVGDTDTADDARIRVYATSSAAGPIAIDRATVSGATPYSSFTVYPIRWVDAADTLPATTRWTLNGP